MNSLGYLKERTNLRTFIVALVMFLIGISLLILSETVDVITNHVWLKAAIANLGGLLVATISIAVLWELFSKRALLDELLAKAGLAEDIRTLGLVGLSVNPLRGPNFSKLIRGATKLDVFVCYANTWRATFEEDLRVLARKPGVRVRLIVPNPQNTAIMAELSRRFNLADEKLMSEKIDIAVKEFKGIFLAANNLKLDFSVWVHDENPVTSFFRFDNIAVVTLYKHAKGRGNVPTFVAERGGTLYTYVEAEVDAMTRGHESHPPLAKRIFPQPGAQPDATQ
jgi:hypothetical protein